MVSSTVFAIYLWVVVVFPVVLLFLSKVRWRTADNPVLEDTDLFYDYEYENMLVSFYVAHMCVRERGLAIHLICNYIYKYISVHTYI